VTTARDYLQTPPTNVAIDHDPTVLQHACKWRAQIRNLAIIPEKAKPMEYTRWAKWLITGLVADATAADAIASMTLYRKCSPNPTTD
jgi:hypothetical protein